MNNRNNNYGYNDNDEIEEVDVVGDDDLQLIQTIINRIPIDSIKYSEVLKILWELQKIDHCFSREEIIKRLEDCLQMEHTEQPSTADYDPSDRFKIQWRRSSVHTNYQLTPIHYNYKPEYEHPQENEEPTSSTTSTVTSNDDYFKPPTEKGKQLMGSKRAIKKRSKPVPAENTDAPSAQSVEKSNDGQSTSQTSAAQKTPEIVATSSKSAPILIPIEKPNQEVQVVASTSKIPVKIDVPKLPRPISMADNILRKINAQKALELATMPSNNLNPSPSKAAEKMSPSSNIPIKKIDQKLVEIATIRPSASVETGGQTFKKLVPTLPKIIYKVPPGMIGHNLTKIVVTPTEKSNTTNPSRIAYCKPIKIQYTLTKPTELTGKVIQLATAHIPAEKISLAQQQPNDSDKKDDEDSQTPEKKFKE